MRDIEKQKIAQKKHYQNNKEQYLINQRAKRDRAKKFISDYKSDKKCERCGENHPACLEFHHNDPSKKEILISKAMYDWGVERLQQEIEKCSLLCANCHRKFHYDEMVDKGIATTYKEFNASNDNLET